MVYEITFQVVQSRMLVFVVFFLGGGGGGGGCTHLMLKGSGACFRRRMLKYTPFEIISVAFSTLFVMLCCINVLCCICILLHSRQGVLGGGGGGEHS